MDVGRGLEGKGRGSMRGIKVPSHSSERRTVNVQVIAAKQILRNGLALGDGSQGYW
jgi:hypothetical protein